MTEERRLAGDVEGSRDPLEEAKRKSIDEERAVKANGDSETDDEDAIERRRAAEIAAASSQSGFT
jgi:hypothetical protein